METWRKILISLMVLLFLAGLGLVLSPYIQGAIDDNRLQREADAFLKQRETRPDTPTQPSVTLPQVTEPEETVPETEPVPTAPSEYTDLWYAMVNYNEQIWLEKQAGLCDPWACQQPSFQLGAYGLEDEVFGVISIPKLDLNMPIYLGATAKHMAVGAAHLSQTSLPIGGENTNCVIAGHRGYGGAAYFRYITDLKIGDEVIITNLWETLTYKVCEVRIIDPNDVEDVLIQEGRELLTLLTCHPYASGGKYRYLVYCERVKEVDAQ